MNRRERWFRNKLHHLTSFPYPLSIIDLTFFIKPHPPNLPLFQILLASIRTNEPGLVEPSPVTGEVQNPAAVTLSAEATPAGVREQQLRYTSKQSSSQSASGSYSSSTSSLSSSNLGGGSSSYGGGSSSLGGGGGSSSYGGGSSFERIQQQRLPLRSGTKY